MNKKIIMSVIAVLAAGITASAEIKTVEGRIARSKNGSEMEIINPNITVMDNKIFAVMGLQGQLEGYEGKKVRITGDLGQRPAGYALFKTIDKVEIVEEQP